MNRAGLWHGDVGDDRVVEGCMEQQKFHQAVHELLAARMISERLRDDEAVRAVATLPVRGRHIGRTNR